MFSYAFVVFFEATFFQNFIFVKCTCHLCRRCFYRACKFVTREMSFVTLFAYFVSLRKKKLETHIEVSNFYSSLNEF